MGLRTPSKVVGERAYLPYVIRYVTHGGAIKYSNIERTVNKKGMYPAQGYTKIAFLGRIGHKDLLAYPNTDRGSAYNLLKQIPNGALAQMTLDTKLYLQRNELKEGVYMTLFVYKFK